MHPHRQASSLPFDTHHLKDIMKSLLIRLFALAFVFAAGSGSLFAAGLQKTDSVVGKGTEAVAGKVVYVNYTGWLLDTSAKNQRGKQFDSSVGRGPFSFPLGAGRVIKGWDEGVAGMKVGGKRTLVIPSELGYGARGAGGVIPPNASLIFDVELLDVK
jgi:FKBP-type peptidyl-prolyl cis-trans isomerase FkpA